MKLEKNSQKIAYYSFSNYKWKSHWSMLQGKLAHVIGWGGTNASSGANRPYATDSTGRLLDEMSAKEVTAFPASKNTVILWIKDLVANIKSESADQWQNCTFGLTNGWLYRRGWTSSFACIPLVSAPTNHQRPFVRIPGNRGAEILKMLNNFWVLERALPDSVKATMGKTDEFSAQMKVAPNDTRSHCFPLPHTHKWKPISLKNGTEEAEKHVNFIKFISLSMS